MDVEVFVFEGRGVTSVDFCNETTDAEDFFGRAEEDAGSFPICPRSTAGAMHVHICGAGDVVVDNELHERDVEAPGSNVCGDEDGARGETGRKALDGAEAGFLGHLGVQRVRWDVEILKKGSKASHGGDGVGKDESAGFGVMEE